MSNKYWQFFSERIPNLQPPNDKGECVVVCVFHKDANPSLAVNIESGKWKCYTPSCPGHAGGGWKKFDKLLRGEVANSGDIKPPPIEESVLDGFHHILLNSSEPMALLKNKRGLTEATVRKYKLGWDSDRILIPVKGPDGSYVNVRKYKYGAHKDKMIAWGPRYNRARLYPFDQLDGDWVLLCEGEMDALLAGQLGFPAVSATGGADTWLDEFNHQLKGKRVVICYDMDGAGRKGAQATAIKLLPHASEVLIASLPLAGSKEEKDVTDFIVTLGHTAADLQKIIDAAEPVAAKAVTAPPPEVVHDIHLSRVGEHGFVGKRVRATVLVAGKDLAPFQVPRAVSFSCAAVGSEKMCDRCGLCMSNGQMDVVVPDWSIDMLRMVNTPIERLNGMLKDLAGIPFVCSKYKHAVTEHANVESIKCIPEIDYQAEDSEYVIRSLFFLGHGIDTNRTYRIEGVVMPDPKTQYATALIYDAKPAHDSIEKFTMTPELMVGLRIFNTRN